MRAAGGESRERERERESNSVCLHIIHIGQYRPREQRTFLTCLSLTALRLTLSRLALALALCARARARISHLRTRRSTNVVPLLPVEMRRSSLR